MAYQDWKLEALVGERDYHLGLKEANKKEAAKYLRHADNENAIVEAIEKEFQRRQKEEASKE